MSLVHIQTSPLKNILKYWERVLPFLSTCQTTWSRYSPNATGSYPNFSPEKYTKILREGPALLINMLNHLIKVQSKCHWFISKLLPWKIYRNTERGFCPSYQHIEPPDQGTVQMSLVHNQTSPLKNIQKYWERVLPFLSTCQTTWSRYSPNATGSYPNFSPEKYTKILREGSALLINISNHLIKVQSKCHWFITKLLPWKIYRNTERGFCPSYQHVEPLDQGTVQMPLVHIQTSPLKNILKYWERVLPFSSTCRTTWSRYSPNATGSYPNFSPEKYTKILREGPALLINMSNHLIKVQSKCHWFISKLLPWKIY